MSLDAQDLGNNNAWNRRRCGKIAFNLQTRHGESVRQRIDIVADIHPFSQPLNA
jgi:hypothetical protein